ncbi:hypothetical protein E4T52_05862 [Aureobasidium sp. EXF-3400]|nr:hypothetical protein E4T51_04982 [Aureobasidium sp. EXF-12344]KAI4779229.1 hypothetical protein E4T52_05862 [Aureobasidium sp. EXF-3400]
MNHPYQITALCNSQAFAPEGLLLAAYGAKIISVKLSDGSIVSQWPEQESNSTVEATSDGPPGKKRKLEPETAPTPNVIKLAVSADSKHVVAVTDDKSVRVLEVTETVTPDNKTILCGDKFGDVYSLPLFPSASVDPVEDSSKVETKEEAGPKKYVPAASTLTVHSGRNRRALENQMKQKDLQAKAKEGLKFECQLLLGHVSMLTDVQFATEEVDGKTRGYIITADRDEHIRISRGAPQAHIIECFCLGHKDFISKICLLPGTDLLISGGGDDWLGVWDWHAGDLREKRDMRSALTALFSSQPSKTSFGPESSIAVSGLWTVPSDTDNKESAILVACEKLPCLLISPQGSASRMVAMSLPGVPLDVTVTGNTVIVSMDVTEASTPRLQAYRVCNNESKMKLELDQDFGVKLAAANNLMLPAPERKQLDNLLYGIENLRKRGAPDEAQDAASEQAIDGAINDMPEDTPLEE